MMFNFPHYILIIEQFWKKYHYTSQDGLFTQIFSAFYIQKDSTATSSEVAKWKKGQQPVSLQTFYSVPQHQTQLAKDMEVVLDDFKLPELLEALRLMVESSALEDHLVESLLQFFPHEKNPQETAQFLAKLLLESWDQPSKMDLPCNVIHGIAELERIDLQIYHAIINGRKGIFIET